MAARLGLKLDLGLCAFRQVGMDDPVGHGLFMPVEGIISLGPERDPEEQLQLLPQGQMAQLGPQVLLPQERVEGPTGNAVRRQGERQVPEAAELQRGSRDREVNGEVEGRGLQTDVWDDHLLHLALLLPGRGRAGEAPVRPCSLAAALFGRQRRLFRLGIGRDVPEVHLSVPNVGASLLVRGAPKWKPLAEARLKSLSIQGGGCWFLRFHPQEPLGVFRTVGHRGTSRRQPLLLLLQAQACILGNGSWIHSRSLEGRYGAVLLSDRAALGYTSYGGLTALQELREPVDLEPLQGFGVHLSQDSLPVTIRMVPGHNVHKGIYQKPQTRGSRKKPGEKNRS